MFVALSSIVDPSGSPVVEIASAIQIISATYCNYIPAWLLPSELAWETGVFFSNGLEVGFATTVSDAWESPGKVQLELGL